MMAGESEKAEGYGAPTPSTMSLDKNELKYTSERKDMFIPIFASLFISLIFYICYQYIIPFRCIIRFILILCHSRNLSRNRILLLYSRPHQSELLHFISFFNRINFRLAKIKTPFFFPFLFLLSTRILKGACLVQWKVFSFCQKLFLKILKTC